MTTATAEERQTVSATHLAVLRCQTWHVWPESTVVEAPPFTLDLGSGIQVPAKLAVVAYLGRTEPAIYAQEKTTVGPLMWTGAIPNLYTVLNQILKAPEDAIQMAIETRNTCRGEVDLSMAFAHAGELSNAAVEAVRCTLFALMSLLNLRLGDFLTPVAPVQIRKLGPTDSQFASNVLLAVRSRRQLASGELEATLKALTEVLSRSPDAEKLRTALELYGSHFFERQARTRFLLLVIALETLAIPTQKHNVALQLLDRWNDELVDAMNQYSNTSAEFASLEGLSREIVHRRENSIRSQIRMLFRSLARANGEDPTSLERRALRVYDARSALVHDGFLLPQALDQSEREARELIEELFRLLLSSGTRSLE
jgi:hypothetical protein